MQKILNQKVFVVDDNLYYGELVARSLANHGFTDVSLFESGEACIEELHLQPALILLDYSMPGLSGIDTLKQIKADYPEVHVVFLSAQENMEIALDSLRYGAFDYLIKDDNSLFRLPLILSRINDMERTVEDQDKKKKVGRIARNILLIGVLTLIYIAAS
jgi:DNA-binding NtrC family response regulator